MKIHDKDPSAVAPSSPPSPPKRRRLPSKRKSSLEADGDRSEEPVNKKVSHSSHTCSAPLLHYAKSRGSAGGAVMDCEPPHAPRFWRRFCWPRRTQSGLMMSSFPAPSVSKPSTASTTWRLTWRCIQTPRSGSPHVPPLCRAH